MNLEELKEKYEKRRDEQIYNDYEAGKTDAYGEILNDLNSLNLDGLVSKITGFKLIDALIECSICKKETEHELSRRYIYCKNCETETHDGLQIRRFFDALPANAEQPIIKKFKSVHYSGTEYYHGKAIYIGDEYPDEKGNEIDVKDDHSNKNAPAYSISFDGKNWDDGFDDDDIEWPKTLSAEQLVSKELDFGDYVEIEQFRYGAENDFYIYKVIKRFKSNGYIDVPVKIPKEYIRDSVVDVVSCICCGVSETEVEKFRIEDVKPTNKRF